jgi:hypothetical protein
MFLNALVKLLGDLDSFDKVLNLNGSSSKHSCFKLFLSCKICSDTPNACFFFFFFFLSIVLLTYIQKDAYGLKLNTYTWTHGVNLLHLVNSSRRKLGEKKVVNIIDTIDMFPRCCERSICNNCC